MEIYFVFLLLAFPAFGGAVRITPCLDDCLCEEDPVSPLIRCEAGEKTELKIPDEPLFGYEVLALPCNDIRRLPSPAIMKVAFPDVKSIDMDGNPSFDCKQVEKFKEAGIDIKHECDVPVSERFNCKLSEKDCDWKCRVLKKIRQWWRDMKDFAVRKSKDIGVYEDMVRAQNWISTKYDSFIRSLGL